MPLVGEGVACCVLRHACAQVEPGPGTRVTPAAVRHVSVEVHRSVTDGTATVENLSQVGRNSMTNRGVSDSAVSCKLCRTSHAGGSEDQAVGRVDMRLHENKALSCF